MQQRGGANGRQLRCGCRDRPGRPGRPGGCSFYRPDDFLQLDARLALQFSDTDPGLRRTLTLAVLPGDQEASRFGLMMIATTGGQLPAGLALNLRATSSGDSAQLSSICLSAARLDKLQVLRTPSSTTSGRCTVASSWIHNFRLPA